MSTLKNYWTIRCCVEELLLNHLEQCELCLESFKEFKKLSNHPGLTDKDLPVDSGFNGCEIWRETELFLTEFEGSLTDEDITEMASHCQYQEDARFFTRYLRENRRKARL